jgi:hypothetical protein
MDMMKNLMKTIPLDDGTKGFRFDFVGLKGISRKRITKKRYGITKGKTFRAIHMGKRSIYIEQFKPLHKLGDWALRDIANAYQLVFKLNS